MRVGAHVSAAGGLQLVPERAHELGLECFQFFSRSPRGGSAPKITPEIADEFKAKAAEYGLESYIHTPYYINFASKKPAIAKASIRIVREELERGSLLGVKYVMTHLGSAREWTERSEALEQVINGVREIYTQGEFTTELLLEISAGAGAVMGDSLEELGEIVRAVGRDDMHVCLDTCHLFASGYDLRDEAGIKATTAILKEQIGEEHLKLIHANDSLGDLDSHKDRHAHIGQGQIGASGFKLLLKDPIFSQANWILETKHDDGLAADIDFLKQNRKD